TVIGENSIADRQRALVQNRAAALRATTRQGQTRERGGDTCRNGNEAKAPVARDCQQRSAWPLDEHRSTRVRQGQRTESITQDDRLLAAENGRIEEYRVRAGGCSGRVVVRPGERGPERSGDERVARAGNEVRRAHLESTDVDRSGVDVVGIAESPALVG